MRPFVSRSFWWCSTLALVAACGDGLTAPAAAPGPLAARNAARNACAVAVADLGTLGGASSRAHDVNVFGQVVGESATAAGETHAFFWSRGRMIDLGTLGGTSSVALGINDAGQVVGYATTDAGEEHAFVWTRAGMRDLGTDGGTRSRATDVNRYGQITGFVENGQIRAVIWSADGAPTYLGDARALNVGPHAISDLGTVVGTLDAGPPDAGFVWRAGSGYTYVSLGGPHAGAEDVNALGQAVGWSELAYPYDVARHAWLWQNGTVTDLGTLSQTPSPNPLRVPSSVARGINLVGQVVGSSSSDAVPGGGPEVAFLWWQGTMSDLGTLPGGATSAADAINAVGQVVGWSGTSDFSTHAAMWTLASPLARTCWGDQRLTIASATR